MVSLYNEFSEIQLWFFDLYQALYLMFFSEFFQRIYIVPTISQNRSSAKYTIPKCFPRVTLRTPLRQGRGGGNPLPLIQAIQVNRLEQLTSHTDITAVIANV